MVSSAFLLLRASINTVRKRGKEMKKGILFLSVILAGIAFSLNFCFAACPFQDGSLYATVKKLVPGKKKVLEKWECVDYIPSGYINNGICFSNVLNDSGDSQYICITGEYRIEFPINEYIGDFF